VSWQDRVEDAVIETAAGDRFVFEFRDIPTNRTELANPFKYPEINKDFVQRKSSGSNVFNITLWFSGDDADTTATTFEIATQDPRALTFTHPLKGSFLVQLMSLQRVDALATSANEVAFSLSLHETIELTKPLASENAAIFIENKKIELEGVNAKKYQTALEELNSADVTKTQNEAFSIIEYVQESIKLYEMGTDQLAEWESMTLSALNLIDTIVANAEGFALVLQGIINFPQRALERFQDKLAFFLDFFDNTEDLAETSHNNILINNSSRVGYAQASIQGNENDYVTKEAVFENVSKIIDLNATYYETIDVLEAEDIDFEPSVEATTFLSDILVSAASNLNDIAFKAKQERIITLKKAEEVYSLVYRLIGANSLDDLDSQIELFIDVNNIKGTEIFELKPGRELKYYV